MENGEELVGVREDPHKWVRGLEGYVVAEYVTGKPMGRRLAGRVNSMNRVRGVHHEIGPANLAAYINEERPNLYAQRAQSVEGKKKKIADRKVAKKVNESVKQDYQEPVGIILSDGEVAERNRRDHVRRPVSLDVHDAVRGMNEISNAEAHGVDEIYGALSDEESDEHLSDGINSESDLSSEELRVGNAGVEGEPYSKMFKACIKTRKSLRNLGRGIKRFGRYVKGHMKSYRDETEEFPQKEIVLYEQKREEANSGLRGFLSEHPRLATLGTLVLIGAGLYFGIPRVYSAVFNGDKKDDGAYASVLGGSTNERENIKPSYEGVINDHKIVYTEGTVISGKSANILVFEKGGEVYELQDLSGGTSIIHDDGKEHSFGYDRLEKVIRKNDGASFSVSEANEKTGYGRTVKKTFEEGDKFYNDMRVAIRNKLMLVN